MNKRGLLIGIVFLSAMIYAQVPEPDGADNTPTVTIDGLLYKLDLGTHTAMVANTNNWEGELYIPEQVAYEGETYTVNSLEWLAFDFCKTLTKVWIPKTVVDIRHYIQWDDCKNPFRGCTSLESIEVDESNPSMCSVDGVLFNKDMTRLFCYPAGARSETYIVPDGVTWLGGDAFAYNSSLTSIYMPNSVAHMAFSTFCNCKSLNSIRLSENIKYIEAYTFDSCDNLRFLDIPESVMGFGESVFRNSPLDTLIIRGTFPDGLRNDTFYFVDKERTVIYCQPSEIDKFKKVFKGTVLPLSDRIEDDYRPFVEEGKVWNIATINPADPSEAKDGYYDILGRRGRVWNRKSYVIEGDTVIGGVTYKKLLSDGKFVCGMREEEGRVYRRGWDRDPDTEALVYDFNAQSGDVFMSTDGFGKIQVKHVREVNINGQNRRCLEMHHYDVDEKGEGYNGGFADYWIEGIGCTGDMHNPFWWDVIGNYPLLLSCYDGDECIFNIEDFNAQISTKPVDDIAYRPFVEEGKVWKVGNTQTILDNSVQVVDYYYFAGDTIIDGKICKQMMCQRFVNPNHPYYEYFPKSPSKVGAWYEENKKIYFYDETRQSTRIMYDFSLNANDTLLFLTDWSSPFIIGPKQTGGIDGFKGVYRDIRMCGEEGQSYHDTFWLEGVGCIRGPISNPCDPILGDPKPEFLMSCTVGDEIIYLNDEVEDGASPEGTGARKKRFDFTHTIKIQPKARKRSEELSLYGEYNDLQLGINLDPLDDAYQVRITDESGKAVYEKSVNAGSIVGLNIDISAYAEGRYTVTVENSQESFTGQFETQATGIEAIRNNKDEKGIYIYNLQGQRLSSLQKGLNIVNGRKIYVK